MQSKVVVSNPEIYLMKCIHKEGHDPMQKRVPAPQPQQETVVLEQLLTIQDIAELLQLSTVKIYRMIRAGSLPSIKIDGARRFKPSEVRAWIEQHSEAS
jgi:excisionase family DNA binding protein